MNWSEFLNIVLKIFVIPLMGVLAANLIAFMKAKTDEWIAKSNSETAAKYIQMARDTVTACVNATNQTFVEVLKKQGKFDKEAQEEAFRRTKDAVLAILTQDAQEYLIQLVGDIDIFLNSLIEAQVNASKVTFITE